MHLFAFDSALGCTAVVVDGRVVLPPIQAARQPNIGERLAHALPEEGLAQFIDTNGRVVCELNAFMTFVRSDGVSLKSANHYARDLQVFARYLQDLHNKSLLHATSADIGAYRRLRREGPARLRLASSSWKRASIALTRFYQWAASEEVGLLPRAPRTLFRRDGGYTEDAIRMVSLDDYVAFRDHVLMGRHSRRAPLRDAAFSELLVTTGLRLEEAASLLVGEMPDAEAAIFSGKRSAMVELSPMITKGRKPRSVPYPKRVARRFVDIYLREERTQLVDRWRRAGGIRQVRDPLVGWLVDSGRIMIDGERCARRLASMQLKERQSLLLLPKPGAPFDTAQPAALWLTERGQPMTTRAWQSIFRRASRHLSQDLAREISISPHTLRHVFAVHWLTHLIKGEVARVEKQDRTDRTQEIYLQVVGDPLRRVQRWLGHSSSLTTQRYLNYLDEAFEVVEQATAAVDHDLRGVKA
jgi:site-specific recombinase XerD